MRQRAVIVWIAIVGMLSGCSNDVAGPDPGGPGESWPGVPLTEAAVQLLTVEPEAVLAPEQAAWIENVRARSTTLDVHPARLAPDAAAIVESGVPLILEVTPDLRYSAVAARTPRRSESFVSWSGRLHEEYGLVTLVLGELGVTGTVRTRTEAYAIEPIGGGLHAVSRVGNYPPD